VVLPAKVIAERHALTTLASAGFRWPRRSRWAFAGADPRRPLPLERRLIERTAPGTRRLAIARIDFLVSTRPAALELNATIPAMPGYSDMAAGAFLSIVGRAAGMDAAALRQLESENGSNVEALHRALVTTSVEERGRPPERIAVLCRRNDSQLSEVDHLVSRFAELGTEAHRVYPDEASGGELFTAHGKSFDFVYRHLFVHRLSETPQPFLEAFFAGEAARGSLLFNAPAAHVEAKSNFALLSRALEEPGLAAGAGLGPEDLEAIRRAVPWTRVLARAPARGPGGEAVPDLVAYVAAHPECFVLKRAWDYGGKAVFVGPASGEPGFATRSEAAFGERLAWPDLVARGGRSPRWRLRGPGGRGRSPRATPPATPGGPVRRRSSSTIRPSRRWAWSRSPWGGVVRASASHRQHPGRRRCPAAPAGVGLGEASPCTPGGILTPPGVL
jgi:hypothetical protein